ncbi:MAG: ABC transporter substrate-binding protein [Chloroflexota bacterium]
MSVIHKISSKHHILIICSLLILVLGIASPAMAQDNTKKFVIGEISNVPGGGVTNPTAATPTAVAPPTATPAVPVPSATTNGQVGSRQLSFRASMADLGYVEGENLTYIFDSDSIAPDKLDAAAQSLVAANVDVIVAYGTTAALAAQRATVGTDIPVIFVGSVDPVQLGLVKSLQNTEGNVTGVGGVSEAYGKELEWLIQLDPAIHTVYVPYPGLSNPLTAAAVKAIQDFADKSGITIVPAELPTPEDVTAALANMPAVDAIMLVPFAPNIRDFIQVGVQNKIPVTNAFPNIMDLGPLLSYNYTEDGIGSTAARFADRILKGAKPSDLPVEIAPNSLAINLKTADAIGLEVSDEVLRQTDIIVR